VEKVINVSAFTTTNETFVDFTDSNNDTFDFTAATTNETFDFTATTTNLQSNSAVTSGLPIQMSFDDTKEDDKLNLKIDMSSLAEFDELIFEIE